MINLLSLSYSQLAILYDLQCRCEQISYEADCFHNCIWVDNQCAEITVCEEINSQYTCNSSSMCVWINQCVPYNGCGNYRFVDPQQCEVIGCYPGIQDNKRNTICSSVPNYRMCYKLITEETCNGRQSDGEICQDLCVVADNSIYNKDNCFLNTFGASTWVESQSECIECRFINTVLIMIYFMHYLIYF